MNRKRLLFWRNWGDAQKTFDKVIDGGFYNPYTPYMCFALDDAMDRGAISGRECAAAKKRIRGYLGRWGFLDRVLCESKLPHSYEDKLKIYRDWANRPKLK